MEKNLRVPVDEKHPISGSQNNYLFSKYMAEQLCNFYRKKIKYHYQIEQYLWSNIIKDQFGSKYSRTNFNSKKEKIKVWNFSKEISFIPMM